MKLAIEKLDRAVAKYGVVELAQKLGVSRQHISNIRKTDYDPTTMKIGLAYSLKSVAGISLDDWFEDSENIITVAQWEKFTGKKYSKESWVWEEYHGDYVPTLWGYTTKGKTECYVIEKPE